MEQHLWARAIDEFIKEVANRYEPSESFYLVCPPTNVTRKKRFIDPFFRKLTTEFPNTIQIDSCLSKFDPNVNASTNSNFDTIKSNISIDEACITARKRDDVNRMLIFDDVYATGVSINATIDLVNNRLRISQCDVYTLLKTV